LSLLSFACGGSTGTAPSTDAGSDGSACGSAVWTPASMTFSLRSAGGFGPQPAPDAGCAVAEDVDEFSLPEKKLVSHACGYPGATDRSVHLTDAEVTEIVA